MLKKYIGISEKYNFFGQNIIILILKKKIIKNEISIFWVNIILIFY